jgi:hypothetical protein
MTLTSTAVAPSVSGNGGNSGIPSFQNVILTYPMAASSSVSKGDFVKLVSTSAGTVSKITATSDTFLGIAQANIDNTYKDDGVTAGAAGDKYCPVLRRGFDEVDARVCASGTYDEAIRMNDIMYLCGSAAEAADIGQRLTSTTDTAVGTAKVAKALDSVAAQSTTGLFKIRVYIDTLTNNLA